MASKKIIDFIKKGHGDMWYAMKQASRPPGYYYYEGRPDTHTSLPE